MPCFNKFNIHPRSYLYYLLKKNQKKEQKVTTNKFKIDKLQSMNYEKDQQKVEHE